MLLYTVNKYERLEKKKKNSTKATCYDIRSFQNVYHKFVVKVS